MESQNRFGTHAFLIIVLTNAAMLVLIYVLGGEAVAGWATGLFGIGIIATVTLGFIIQQLGKRAIQQALEEAPPKAVEPAPAPTPVEPAPETKPLPKPEHPYEASAVQILSILQRKGRLLDFLQEDLQAYDDAQIGAAVRPVHEGCKSGLAEIVTLEPVFDQPEGSSVPVEAGFDARAVRLTGNVAGDPPFKGVLQHRGWRVARIDLPEKLKADEAKVVAPAEVEVR